MPLLRWILSADVNQFFLGLLLIKQSWQTTVVTIDSDKSRTGNLDHNPIRGIFIRGPYCKLSLHRKRCIER